MNRLSKGIVQVYTGSGKGKTTAAIGLAVRALGHNLNVCFIQFMKNDQHVGELVALRAFPNCQIRSFGSGQWVHKGKARPEDIAEAKRALEYSKQVVFSGEFDLVILDEVINAIWFELITEQEVLDLIVAKPDHVELVLTGRNASSKLIENAGLVTEMRQLKHPFEQGLGARKGIEF